MYTRLLVPLDGTPDSEVALAPARTLATAVGAEVVTLELQSRAGTAQTADTIIAEAEGREASLIVMATYGLGGHDRPVTGSVAGGVLTHSRIPVLLVRPGEAQMERLKLTLVPVDGSPDSLVALGHASRLARAVPTALVLLRVVVPLPLWIYDPSLGLNTGPLIDPRWDEDRRQHAESYVRQLAQTVANSGIEVGADAVLDEVAAGICTYADQQAADLIVMSTHGRRGPARALLGSVADEVVRTAHQPVLLINRDMVVGSSGSSERVSSKWTSASNWSTSRT
jgi:nucleotide-binding universal stress UspA family protein